MLVWVIITAQCFPIVVVSIAFAIMSLLEMESNVNQVRNYFFLSSGEALLTSVFVYIYPYQNTKTASHAKHKFKSMWNLVIVGKGKCIN